MSPLRAGSASQTTAIRTRRDTLVITAVDGSTALGVITITDDGQSLLYEPSQSLSEGSVDDVFSYTISDGNTTATATVTVTGCGG